MMDKINQYYNIFVFYNIIFVKIDTVFTIIIAFYGEKTFTMESFMYISEEIFGWDFWEVLYCDYNHSIWNVSRQRTVKFFD